MMHSTVQHMYMYSIYADITNTKHKSNGIYNGQKNQLVYCMRIDR